MQMRTPDISIVFDMTFTGLNEAYDADLTINWSEVRNSQSFGAGGSVYFVGADVELAFDELRRNNAIKLRSSGSDAAMEGAAEHGLRQAARADVQAGRDRSACRKASAAA